MIIPLEVILMANKDVLNIIKIMIVLIGFTAIFLTINFYKCKWLRFVFITLGLAGLISLLLFMLSGSFCVFGLFGSIGLVLTLHCLVLKQIKNDLNGYDCVRPCPKPCPDPCDPCDKFEAVEKENNFNSFVKKLGFGNDKGCNRRKKEYFSEKCENEKEIVKSDEVKIVESSAKTPCGSRYDKYYHKKSSYKNKSKNCKRCYSYNNVCCPEPRPMCCKNFRRPCDTNSCIFNEMYVN